jgi:hypothetical protein
MSSTMQTVDIRMPKVVQWRPQPDITPFELAQAVTVLFGIALGARFPEDDVARLPADVQRHFHVGDHPVFK